MLTITTDIDKTVKKYNMLCAQERVVVGVSGGADSMLLLNYLLDVREEYSLDVVVANVEHGIRGTESEMDSAFVEDFCKSRGIEFHMLKLDAVNEAKKAGMGVEEYSREKRYEFFSSLGGDKTAVAHNASDNLETFLFRLSRGMGVNGASSIKGVRDNIIRPLIELSSKEIRRCCDENNIQYVIDTTNETNEYSRNYIRNVIIPEFEKLNPSFEECALRFVESMSETSELLNELANDCLSECVLGNMLELDKLRKYNPAVIKAAISKYAENNSVSLDYKHISDAFRLVYTPSKLQLKGNIYAVSNKNYFRITEFSDTKIDEFEISTQTVSKEYFDKNCNRIKKEFAFYLDCDKIYGKLFARSRADGDKIKPAGRNVTKTLKKLYNELEIPVEIRNNIPVLCDDMGVIGVKGVCIDERVKIDNNTDNVIIIRVEDNS